LFPLFESEYGEITARTSIRRPQPVDAYLKLQKRFAHLFRPVRDEIRIGAIQNIAIGNIQRFGLLEEAAQ
jgi:pyruvate ferredoxin oxidoreductase beta subunit